jgi:hypothetical protein
VKRFLQSIERRFGAQTHQIASFLLRSIGQIALSRRFSTAFLSLSSSKLLIYSFNCTSDSDIMSMAFSIS